MNSRDPGSDRRARYAAQADWFEHLDRLDPPIARRFLQRQAAQLLGEQDYFDSEDEAVVERLDLRCRSDSLAIGQFLTEVVPQGVSEAGYRCFTATVLLSSVEIALAEAVLKVNPGYLRKVFPDDLVTAMTKGEPADRFNAMAFAIADYDICVQQTGGSDENGLGDWTNAPPVVRHRTEAAIGNAANMALEWLSLQQSLTAERALPSLDDLLARNFASTVVLYRHPDAPRSALQAHIAVTEGVRTVPRLGGGQWDGTPPRTEQGWQISLALDVLRACGLSPVQARVLAHGPRGGANFGAVIHEVDAKLNSGRTGALVTLSVEALSQWVAKCETSFPSGDIIGVDSLRLPEIRLRALEARCHLDVADGIGH